MQQGIPEPIIFGYFDYKFKSIVGKPTFSYQFKNINKRVKKVGLDVSRQSACLVLKKIVKFDLIFFLFL